MNGRTEILIADDHLFARQQIRRLLDRRSGWHVCDEASNGTQAVEMAKRHCPDVALLDAYMPEMDGFEAARKIRAICPCTLILMESFQNFQPYVAHLRDIGIRGFVQKDRIDTDLIPAIESVLNDEGEGYVHS